MTRPFNPARRGGGGVEKRCWRGSGQEEGERKDGEEGKRERCKAYYDAVEMRMKDAAREAKKKTGRKDF